MSTPLRLLVVEDSTEIREALVEVLAASGFLTRSAANGAEALALLDQMAAPDLILLDLMMPIMDGIEFRRNQLAEPVLKEIPVIVLTANPPLLAPAVLDGVRVLQKPIDVGELLDAIDLCQPHRNSNRRRA